MITKWGVSNFKSILNANLDLAPLTIFTGVNSSGKSSFLRSIAMMAQSVRLKDGSPVTLNGDFVNLGNFNSLYFKKAFEYNSIPNQIEINCTIQIHDYDYILKLGFNQKNKNENDLKINSFNLKNKNDKGTISYINKNIQINEADEYVHDIEAADDYFEENNIDEGVMDNNSLKELLNNIDSSIYNKDIIPNDKLQLSFKDDFLPHQISVNLLLKKMKSITDQDKKINLGVKKGDILNLPIPTKIQEAADYLRNYFETKMIYLGPLREEPKDEYEYSNKIGSKGEGAPGFIHYFHNEYGKVINYFSPLFIEKSEYKLKNLSIYEALKEWLEYICISQDFKTKKIDGAENISINLVIDKTEFTPAQLGTGVSQILPILVVCLTAQPGSTIILEQPESQLHPKFQSKLADFFIAMALSGRQCLIETHSEYMINKLRYRILSISEDANFHEKIKLYFAEKNNGTTYFKDIGLNKYAALDEWPDDFFDESSKLSDKIIDAAMKRMKDEEEI